MKNLLSFDQFINEKFNHRDPKSEIFNYSSMKSSLWRPKILAAQKFQKIEFDLENNESTGEKKGLIIPAMLRKDQQIKYTYECELCVAGGDWQDPVYYFKVESTYSRLTNQEYSKSPEYIFDTYKSVEDIDYNKWVIIPPKNSGNLNLIETNSGWVAKDSSSNRQSIKTKPMWDWLESVLQELVTKRHRRLD